NGVFYDRMPLVEVPFINQGTLRLEPSADKIRFASLDNAGRMSIAPRPLGFGNFVEVVGDFVQRPSGTLTIEIADERPLGVGLLAGRLDVTGQAMLAGNLEVDYVRTTPADPAEPVVGTTWPLLQFASRSGDFSQMTSLDLAEGF